jgi:hypothetical protein
VSWFYLEYEAFLSRLSPWALVFAEVFLRELIDMRVGAFERLCELTRSPQATPI